MRLLQKTCGVQRSLAIIDERSADKSSLSHISSQVRRKYPAARGVTHDAHRHCLIKDVRRILIEKQLAAFSVFFDLIGILRNLATVAVIAKTSGLSLRGL